MTTTKISKTSNNIESSRSLLSKKQWAEDREQIPLPHHNQGCAGMLLGELLAEKAKFWMQQSRKDLAKLEAQTVEHTECICCAHEQFRMKHGPALTHQQHMRWANKTDEKHEKSLANKYREALNKAKNYKDELEGLKLCEEECKAARIQAHFQGETMDTMVFYGRTCRPRQREINLSKVMAAVAAHGRCGIQVMEMVAAAQIRCPSQPAVVIPHCIWTPDQPPPSSAAQSGLLQAPTAALQDQGLLFPGIAVSLRWKASAAEVAPITALILFVSWHGMLSVTLVHTHIPLSSVLQPLPKLPVAVVKANTPTLRSWCLLWQWKLGGKAAEKKRGKGTSTGKGKGKAVEVSESEDEEDAQSSGADSNSDDEPPRKRNAAEEDQDSKEAPTAKKSKKAPASATKATKPAACATSTAAATAKPKKKAGGKAASSALPEGCTPFQMWHMPPKAAAALVSSSDSDSDSD
ncbi:hypothetical protein C8J57DRAFT_1519133 [Mycena rebaudengoi]|nr:hypothetical protein C8J57DRAFT_1519133 [Mycena rebaudengoi]